MLKVVDNTTYRKHIELVTYPYGIKGKLVYFFRENPNDVCIVKVEKREAGYNVVIYFHTEGQVQNLKDSDENIILTYCRAHSKESDTLLLFDFKNSWVVYDFTDSKEISPLYRTFDVETSRELLGVSISFKSSGEREKKIFSLDVSKEVMKAMTHFVYVTTDLLAPLDKPTDYGASLAFFLGNSLNEFPTTLETYIDLKDFQMAFRKKGVVSDNNLLRLKRLVDVVNESITKKKEAEKEKSATGLIKISEYNDDEEEDDLIESYYLGVDKEDNKEVKRFKLSEIVERKKANFSNIGRFVDIDIFQEQLADVKEIFVLRSKITFYLDSNDIFNGRNLNKRLEEIKELIGVRENIGVNYYSDEEK